MSVYYDQTCSWVTRFSEFAKRKKQIVVDFDFYRVKQLY